MRLTAAAVLVLATACSSSSPKTAAPSPSTAPVVTAAPTRPATPTVPVAVEQGPYSFALPGKDISCSLDAATARCDAAQHSWHAPAKPSDCFEKWGFGIQYSLGGRGSFICADDSVLGATRVLAYGRGVRVGMVQCTASRAGVECRGVGVPGGFALSSTQYRLF